VSTQEEAFHSPQFGVDYNVIFLLIGMMIIVNIIRKTGLFEWLAIWAARRAKARPFRMIVLLSAITALLSALLDNVTTVLLMAPVTLELTRRLELNPIPFLLSEAMASNIGGTATLVGDPPNIMIASKAGLGYLDFLVGLGPIVVVVMGVYVFGLWLVFGRNMRVAPHLQAAVLGLDPHDALKDPAFLRRCLWLLGTTTLGFCFHDVLHMQPATVALLGASMFMLIGEQADEPADRGNLAYLAEVEWKTIFFFIGLFILVGGLVKVGVIRYLADQLVSWTSGNLPLTAMLVLWGSAVISAIVDNIPYVAAMNPLILDLAKSLHPSITDPIELAHQPDILPLWWALALGACLGGNGTMIGATANVVIVDLAYREGHRIGFWRFFLFGLPVMLGSVLLSAVYLWLRFF
jgi:Na+/H+ antiporter NhaD/arsenite permease-like protein